VNKLKHGTASIVVVASLGLLLPSAFGGSASADVSHNPNHDQTPFTVACDLDGDSNGDTTYVASHYETPYSFVSTANSKAMHDQHSNTVMTHRERIDVLQADYVDPDDPSLSFTDTYVEWFDRSDVSLPPDLRHTVRCVNIADPYEYTATADDVDAEPRFVEGVTYFETDYQLYVAQLSGGGQGTGKAANVGSSGTHHKQGHHRSHKGKHSH
jgi:hypothetical protein